MAELMYDKKWCAAFLRDALALRNQGFIRTPDHVAVASFMRQVARENDIPVKVQGMKGFVIVKVDEDKLTPEQAEAFNEALKEEGRLAAKQLGKWIHGESEE